jgi:hypothetical protein
MKSAAAIKKTKSLDSTIEEFRTRAESKRKDIEELLKCKVFAFCYSFSEEDFGMIFIKEPDFRTEKIALDMAPRSMMDAGEFILDSCIVKEESDPRIWCEDAESLHKKQRIGAIISCRDLVTYSLDIIKKK